ncbi:MAG: PEGA domain-containing protein [Nitrosomonadales bacterium]|nr:PEGA domain-containing protein [Nitrosomonadales bacterium]
MEQHGNKTVMCSVLFLDIVEYSKKPVSGQIALKKRLNAFLASAIHDVPINDRIILDTGDGAAISFLGDVEDAIKVALALRACLLNEDKDTEHPLRMCMGINLGPVRLIKDINGQPNIVGDGINVAQRIMGFAQPGQILTSRSYFDAVSRLSHEYAGLFHSRGSRTDKHVREHEIYAIAQVDDAAVVRIRTGKVGLGDAREWAQRTLGLYRNASVLHRVLYVVTALAALVFLILAGVKIATSPDAPAPRVEAKARPGASSEHVVSEVPALPPAVKKPAPEPLVAQVVAPTPKKNEIMAAPPKNGSVAAQKPKTVQPAREAGKQASATPKKSVVQKNPHAPKAGAVAKPAATAQISIAVTPWGEIYLDGKIQGISPPLEELKVTPGKHVIEIFNTSFPTYRQNVQLKAGGKIKIKYKFAN